MGDFKAFYCAGNAFVHHQNPYATMPLARCESVPAPAPLFVTKRGEVLPAPLPGYAIPAFVPFALLPFPMASALWLFVLGAASVAAILLLAKVGVADPWTLAIALALIIVAICFPVGELPPLALFGIALAAYGARANRGALAGIGIAIASFEPQIGIGMLVACLALGGRFARIALWTAIALGAAGLAAIGIAGNLEYMRVVLPAHLMSELPSVLQYSLSWMLYRLGVAPSAAILYGRLSWIAMLGVTAWFARSPYAKANPEVAFLAAPAFAVVGGPFLHLDHIALAIPMALWLSSRATTPLWIRVAAPIALSIPVLYVFSIIQLAALVPVIAAWVGAACSRQAIVGLRAALAAIVLMAAIGASTIATGTGSMHLAPVEALPANLPQAAWASYVGKTFVMTAWTIWFVKAPIWFGILATSLTLVLTARATRARAMPA